MYFPIGHHCTISSIKQNSVLFIHRGELLRELFIPHNCEKWVHNPVSKFSVQAKVDQMSSVNAPT